MPYHMAAWSQSVLTAGTFQEIDAVDEEVLFTSGKDIRVSSDWPRLIGYAAAGASTAQARIEAPSLRGFLNQAVAEADPLETLANPDDVFRALFGDPLPLMPGESLTFLSDGGGDGVTAEDVSAVILVADGAPQPVTGDIRTVRATTVLAGIQREWVSAQLIFDEQLPGGRFQLVGAAAEGVGAFRFIVAGQSNRPGGFARANGALGTKIIPGQRRGGWGVWGEFDVNRPPVVEVLSLGGAATNPDIWLDLVMLG